MARNDRIKELRRLLVEAGGEVHLKGIAPSPPSLAQLPADLGAAAVDRYRALGGRLAKPRLAPGAWDMEIDGVLVEFDEHLHFNRYRAVTLESPIYDQLPAFPLTLYRGFAVKHEADCLAKGKGQGRWTNAGAEKLFGRSGPRGKLEGRGSARWRQRALYDFMKDLVPLAYGGPVARVSIWDELPTCAGVRIEDVVAAHKQPSRCATALRDLILSRAAAAYG